MKKNIIFGKPSGVKRYILLLAFIVISLSALGQQIRPVPSGMSLQYFGSPTTLTRMNGILYPVVGYAPAIYADTTAANLNIFAKNTPLFQIGTTSDGKTWQRNYACTKWESFVVGTVAGIGTLTNFSAGNFSPLFTTSVANSTSTPALSFLGSSINQYQVLGRSAIGSGAYSFLNLDTNFISGFSTNVRPLFSAGTGLSYNSLTGVFTNTATGGGGNNLYNIDSTLKDNRTVTMGGRWLKLYSDANDYFQFYPNSLHANYYSAAAKKITELHTGSDSFYANIHDTSSGSAGIETNFLLDGAGIYSQAYTFGGGIYSEISVEPSKISLNANLGNLTADTVNAIYTTVGKKVVTWDTTTKKFERIEPATLVNAWGLSGNSGTTPGTNFIGTTDGVGLKFKVNNLQSGFIDLNLGNTSFGYQSLINDISGDNTAFGTSALTSNTLGYRNTAIGKGSLQLNISGIQNTAVGHQSLVIHTSGSYNTAVGAYSLYADTSGYSNTAVGVNSGFANVSGFQNTFIGAGSGENHTTGAGNTFLGYDAGLNNTVGNYNTYTGWNAKGGSKGAGNVGTGYYAGGSLGDTSSYNTFVGYYSGYNASQEDTVYNSIAIGANTYTTKSNQMVLGNTSLTETIIHGIPFTVSTTGKKIVLQDTVSGLTEKIDPALLVTESGIGDFQDSIANVLYFGADPTGSAGSAFAFQDAIATGRTVYVPKGRYKIEGVDSVLTLLANQTIFGDGESSELFTTTNGTTVDLTTNFNFIKLPNGHSTVRDLKFTGNGKTSYVFPWTTQNGVWVYSSKNRVEGCTFVNLRGTGVFMVHPSLSTFIWNIVTNNRFDTCTAGTFTYIGAEYITFSANVFNRCDYGINEWGANNTFSSCILEENNINGSFQGNGGNSDHSYVNGCIFNHGLSKNLDIDNIVNTLTFTGGGSWATASTVDQSVGVSFVNFQWGTSANLTVTASSTDKATFLTSCFKATASPPTFTESGTGKIVESGTFNSGVTSSNFTKNVGIGISSPIRKLDVTGTGYYSDTLWAAGRFGATNIPFTVSTTGKKIVLQDTVSGLTEKIDPALLATPTLNQYQIGVGNASNQLSGSSALTYNGGKLLANSGGVDRIKGNGDTYIGSDYWGAMLKFTDNSIATDSALLFEHAPTQTNFGSGSSASRFSIAGSLNTSGGAYEVYTTKITNQSVRASGANSLTNIGLYDSVSGGQFNYAIVVPSGGGNVGIGTSTPSATLDLVGTLQYTDGNQGANKVLTSDASGNATWQTPTGSVDSLVYSTRAWRQKGDDSVAALVGAKWDLTGNTVGAFGKYIGTNDNYTLRFRTNGTERWKIDSSSGSLHNGGFTGANASVAPLTISADAQEDVLHTYSNGGIGGQTITNTGIKAISYLGTAILGAAGLKIKASATAATAHASSIVDIESTGLGFLYPRMTTTQQDAISSPATGLQIFNTTDSAESTYRGIGAGWSRTVYTSDTSNMLANYLKGGTAGYGITLSGTQHKTWTVDTLLMSTKAWRQKGIDSVAALVGGNVTKVGTPVNNQVGVWTGDGTIEGDANFTWTGSQLSVTGNTGSPSYASVYFSSTDATANRLGINHASNVGVGYYLGGAIKFSNAVYDPIAGGNKDFAIYNDQTTNNSILIDGATDNVGMGGAAGVAPSARLHIVKTTEQLRVGSDGSNYFSTTINSTGSATLDLIGTTPEFTFSDAVNVPDEAYGAGWDGNTEVPTKNAVYDKIQTIGGGGLTVGTSPITGGTSGKFLYNSGGILFDTTLGSNAFTSTAYVPQTTTVAGFALSGNVALADLTATNTTLTFSGTYNGSTARTIGLNLENANTWTAAQTNEAAAPQLILGKNVTTLGSIKMFGNTSGDVTLQPTAAAGTATVQTLPATTGTLVNRVTTANGVSATNSDGALTISLGAITPSSSTISGLMKSKSLNFGVQSIATAAGTTTLTSSSEFQTIFTGATTQNCDLPDATTLTVGHRFKVSNNSTGLVTVRTNGGATYWILGASTDIELVCTDVGTAAGTWEKDYRVGNNATGKVATFNSTSTFSGTDAATYTFPGASQTLASLAGTETLTNKRMTPRDGSTASSATPTINTDNVDIYRLTAQTVDITSFTTNLSGTPTQGQRLVICITGTASRAITWGASFVASSVALPTTTSGTSMLCCQFIWDGSNWRITGYY